MSGQKFFTFRRPPDWRRGVLLHLSLGDDGLTIERRHVYRPYRRYEAEHPRIIQPVCDAAGDDDGRWFLLDGSGALWKTDSASGHTELLLAAGHGWFGPGSSIGIFRDALAVADPQASPTLVVLSSDTAQVIWTKSEWRGEPYRSLAVAADDKDGCIVLGEFAGGEGTEQRLLRYDRAGNELGSVQLAVTGTAGEEEDGARRRFEISAGPNGAGIVFDRVLQRVARYRFAESGTNAMFFSVPEHAAPVNAILDVGPRGYWAVRLEADTAGRELLRINDDGTVAERGEAGAGSGADRLLSDSDGRISVWDAAECAVTFLRPTTETDIWEPFQRRTGAWISGSLDSTSAETVWHKLVMEASGEPDTQIRVRYYASDRKQVTAGGEWVDLDQWIRDKSLDPLTKLDGIRHIWSDPIVGPSDALFLKAQGRYLWLYIEWIGSKQHAPLVSGLQVHFPRKTYMEDLPALYQQDEKSRDFLERYLSLFQTMMYETDTRIREVPRSLDADAANGSSLRWLLGWLGLNAEDHWTDDQLRALLRAAPTIYKLRGTKLALETLIAVYTGERPIILEHDQLKPLKENPGLAEVAEKLYSTDIHGFNVLVKPEHADTDTKRVTLQNLIDACRPAFTVGKLIILQPWVYMDLHSYLGLNTVLSEPTLLTLDGRSSMPHHTITIDVGQDNRVDQHTRLELDSRLE